MIALADLKGLTEEQVISHLVENYSDTADCRDDEYITDIVENKINDGYREVALYKLKYMKVLVAYESIGPGGCDSKSFFLLRSKTDGSLYEIHGSHCSCYGFEGQLDLEPTDIKSLKYRAINADVFYAGCYDDDETKNQRIVNEYVLSMELPN